MLEDNYHIMVIKKPMKNPPTFHHEVTIHHDHHHESWPSFIHEKYRIVWQSYQAYITRDYNITYIYLFSGHFQKSIISFIEYYLFIFLIQQILRAFLNFLNKSFIWASDWDKSRRDNFVHVFNNDCGVSVNYRI